MLGKTSFSLMNLWFVSLFLSSGKFKEFLYLLLRSCGHVDCQSSIMLFCNFVFFSSWVLLYHDFYRIFYRHHFQEITRVLVSHFLESGFPFFGLALFFLENQHL